MFAVAAIFVVVALGIASIIGGIIHAMRTYKEPEPEFEPVAPQVENPDTVVLDDGTMFGREIKRTWGDTYEDSDGNKWRKRSNDKYELDD